MRLLVVSHTPHHRRGDTLVGWGPTVRELDALAAEFGAVTHVAPLHAGPAPESATAYAHAGVRVHAVPAAGGPRWRDKAGLGVAAAAWTRALLTELPRADLVHVRCPAAISGLALGLLAARPRPAWVKYAGAWNGAPEGDPRTYRWQRAWLARPHARMLVTVNGTWPGQPAHVRSFPNPCLDEAELAVAARAVGAKAAPPPWRLLFVGSLDDNKRPDEAVAVLAALRAAGVDATLDIVGEGARRVAVEAAVAAAGLGAQVRLHGWVARERMGALYATAHVVILPSRSEGWPKVLSEGMAYGALPVATQVGSVAQILGELGVGVAVPVGDVAAMAAAIAAWAATPGSWDSASRRAQQAAPRFTFESYRARVRALASEVCS